MKLAIDCPNGSYDEKMKINCSAVNGRCGNQRFKSCKGWWVLTENAKNCPMRNVTKEHP